MNMTMRRLAFFLLPLLIASSYGCKPAYTGRPPRPKAFTKIVSLSPGTTEIVAGQTDALGRVVGRTQSDNWPTYAIQNVPVVASVKPDFEAIAAIGPDLVLYDAALYGPADIEKLKTTAKGAAIFAITANTIDEFTKQLYEIGSMVGGESRINDYVIKIYGARERGQADAAKNPAKVAIIMPSSSGPDYIAGTDSFLADAVRAAGGTPVGPKSSIFVPLSPEALSRFNPDAIVVPGTKSNYKGALSVLENPAYKTTKAIKSKQVSVVDQDVLLRRGGRVDVLIDGLNKVISKVEGQ
jgi:iron complex transport system substrate-binding protein